jgi:cellulose synthase/poly-beta-1,6-N-acetylglucosamine synthase-like glycosyltransferase
VPQPELSVVLVVGPRRLRAAWSLEAVLDQDVGDRLEVVLVDLAADGTQPIAGAGDPRVRLLRAPPDTVFSDARALGVEAAGAPLVAFVEEHARPRPGWAAALLAAAAEDEGWAAMGPAIASANPGTGFSDASYLMGYALFRPEVAARGDTRLVPGQNSCYRRQALRSFGSDLATWLSSDNVLVEGLARRGHRLTMVPAAVVEHRNEARVRVALAGYWAYHRIYGHRRSRLLGWSPARRLAHVVLAPLVPLYFLALALGRTRREPQQRSVLWRHLPAILLVQSAAALAQAIGIVRGPGTAPRRFTRVELDADRPLAAS